LRYRAERSFHTGGEGREIGQTFRGLSP
jgi:hypothetical protein